MSLILAAKIDLLEERVAELLALRRADLEEYLTVKNDRDRFRVVLEWLEENYPAALELCPYKAPTQPTEDQG